MSDRNWALGSTAAVILIAYALISFDQLSKYGQANREHNAEASEPKIDQPPGYVCEVHFPRIACGPTPAYGTGNADKNVQYDLQAQQDMAYAAFAMLAATGAGIILSVVGIIYIGMTFHETHQTNVNTKEVGDAQVAVAHLAIKQAENAMAAHIAAQVKPLLTIEISGPVIDNYDIVDRDALAGKTAPVFFGAHVAICNVTAHVATLTKVRLYMNGHEGFAELHPFVGRYVLQPEKMAWVDRLAVGMALSTTKPATSAAIARGPVVASYDDLPAVNQSIPEIIVTIGYEDVFGNAYEAGWVVKPVNGWCGKYREQESYDRRLNLKNA